MASTKLYKQQVNASNRKKFTISLWFKRSGLTGSSGNGQYLFESYLDSSNRIRVELNSNEELKIIQNQSGSTNFKLSSTSMKFRDTSGWYHLVIAVDTTLSTASDRGKMYINGTRITSFSSTTDFPLDNTPSQGNSGYGVYIGGYGGGSSNFYDGLISHYNFVDGTAYDPSYFGETDATTGEWKIKTSPSVTYGANGFFILKDGNSVTDQSGNSNNFAVSSGTLTKTEDCPDNVFATMNPLDNYYASSTFSNGNNTIVTNQSNYTWNTATLGMTSGKFYWEVKYSANSNSELYNLIGIADRPTDDVHDVLGRQTNCSNYGYYAQTGGIYAKSTSITSYGNAYGVGDIVGVAVDLDNSKLYFSKNGTWQNSGVPTSGSTGTGAFSIDAISSTTTGVYFPASGDYGSSQYVTNQHNFGNGYFGTTAVSSAGSNASGIGIFEYDVPTGFTALSTKGLNL